MKNLLLIIILITALFASFARTVYSQVLSPEQKKHMSEELESDLKGLDLVRRLQNQALILCSQENYSEAAEKLKKALEIVQRESGPYSRKVIQIMSNIAEMHEKEGKYNEAIEYYKKLLEIEKNISGSESRAVAGDLWSLSDLYWEMDNYSQVELCRKEALSIYEKILNPDAYPDSSTLEACYNGMAGFYRSIGRSNDAKEFEERVNKMRLKQRQ